MSFESFCISELGVSPNSVRKSLLGWIEEDCGHGDLTVSALGKIGLGICKAKIVAKESFVVCGIELAAEVFVLACGSSDSIEISRSASDGKLVQSGETLLELKGQAAGLLMGERTALNLMARLSGVAQYTCQVSKKLQQCFEEVNKNAQTKNTSKITKLPQLLETRKTTPGLKIFEKYATRTGGARNHRMALDSGAMLKENHFRAGMNLGESFESVMKAVRDRLPLLAGLEIEVTNFEELEAALRSGCEVIMLDNFSLEQITDAVKLRDKLCATSLLELSGNLDRADPSKLAASGVDLISMGALIHQARWVDMSLQFQAMTPGNTNEGRV